MLLESLETVRKAHAKARNRSQTWRKIDKLASQYIPHEHIVSMIVGDIMVVSTVILKPSDILDYCIPRGLNE